MYKILQMTWSIAKNWVTTQFWRVHSARYDSSPLNSVADIPINVQNLATDKKLARDDFSWVFTVHAHLQSDSSQLNWLVELSWIGLYEQGLTSKIYTNISASTYVSEN